MGAHHVMRLSKIPEVELVALCDVTEANVRAAIEDKIPEKDPPPAIYTDPAKMYAEAKPDAVVIVTPHTMHFDHAVQAIEAGCHVLLEKPMVTDSRQAYRLKEILASHDRVFTMGYNSSCCPTVAYTREAIRNAEFGALSMVSVYILQGWRNGTLGQWRQDPDLSGGGMAYDSGAHVLNTLCWTIESRVDEVMAYVHNRGTPVDIDSSILIRFENGVYATVMIGGNCPTSSSNAVYVFENGKIELDAWSGATVAAWRDKDEVYRADLEDADVSSDTNFIDAILGRAEAATNVEHGIVHSELMDAIYESARCGHPVSPERS
tara:strand:- start:823 stop:1782 length:960 start_codon:yes stop_codon:yes gene_type:complete